RLPALFPSLLPRPPSSTLFPYTTLFRSEAERVAFWDALDFVGVQAYYPLAATARPPADSIRAAWDGIAARLGALAHRTGRRVVLDRKSTRLNSSHVSISYAVFCLKKKKN